MVGGTELTLLPRTQYPRSPTKNPHSLHLLRRPSQGVPVAYNQPPLYPQHDEGPYPPRSPFSTSPAEPHVSPRPFQFLELPELDVLSRALNLTTPTLRVQTRVEAYSCKAIGRERRLFKALESELIQDISHSTSVSPPEQHQGLLDSAFGPLDKRASRKTLWLLIGLLNVAFPDHDFSKVRPEEFSREESARAVLSSLSAALDHLRSPASQRSFSSYPPSTSFNFPSSPFTDSMVLPTTTPHLETDAIPTNPFLRQVLDPIIDLAECEVFSYTPDMDSDPHAAESDDESDEGGDSDAFEKDDDGGIAWEMDGVDSYRSTSARRNLASSSSRNFPTTPMKSFSSFFPPSPAPDTPTSTVDDSEDYFRESSSGGLLWSSNFFLFNKKMKRILFISIWARRGSGSRGVVESSGGGSSSMKRKASTSSISFAPQRHEGKKAMKA